MGKAADTLLKRWEAMQVAPPYEVSPYQLGCKLMALFQDLSLLMAQAGFARPLPSSAGCLPDRLDAPDTLSEPAPGAIRPPSGIREEVAELRRRLETLERWLEAATGSSTPSPASLPDSAPRQPVHPAVPAASHPSEAVPAAQGGEPGSTPVAETSPAPAAEREPVTDAEDEKKGEVPARLPRQVTRQRALSAARRLRRLGEPITLASVARTAGLKYSQVVYAFGRRESLLTELRED